MKDIPEKASPGWASNKLQLQSGELVEELKEFTVDDSDRMVKIGSQLDGKLTTQLEAFLPNNIDVFA